MNTGRFDTAGAGTTSAGLAYGGSIPGGKYAASEEWTGAGAPVGVWATVNGVNTARQGSMGSSSGTLTASFLAGGYTTTNVANTETWNGTNWTEVNDMNTTCRVYTSDACVGYLPSTSHSRADNVTKPS